MSDIDYIENIREGWSKHLEATEQLPENPEPRVRVWASQRRKCVRRMALDLMHPEDQEPWRPDTMERMKTGKERESDITARLGVAGKYAPVPFRVRESQLRFRVKWRGRIVIGGILEGRLEFDNGVLKPYEIKSGDAVRRVERHDDFERSEFIWHYPDQLLIGMDAVGAESGVFICDRPGLPPMIEYRAEDHVGRVKQFKRDAHVACLAAAGKRDLPDHCSDASLCKACPHLHKSCSPPKWSEDHPETVMITDEPTLEAIERHEQLRPASDEFRALDKQLKEELRGTLFGVAGSYVLKGRWGKQRKLPDEAKAAIKRIREEQGVDDPKGSYTLKIERIGSDASD